MLNYRTRGGVNPTGKLKIYFASAIDDFGYLQDVSRHILNLFDAAIFYEEDGLTENTSDEVLLEMGMIVAVISEGTLSSVNDVSSRILPMALNCKLPFLPLGVMPGIGSKLNQFCEANALPKIDVVYPNSDKSGVSFAEKLYSFMNKKLIDADFYERVRSNFYNSFFVSYRKKDKEVLLNVLEKIYKNEICREVLVWYDEYLTAGENYDTEIQSMIDNSDLFIILLTENMLKEENYAIREELSHALRMDKEILAIDLCNGEYPVPESLIGNPGCTVVRNVSEQFLGEFLQERIFLPQFDNKRDMLEHRYLLGMAYYQGIAALKDRDYGFYLVKWAAENGLIEAMEMLVKLSIEDRGDWRTAILYQSKIVDYYDYKAMQTRQLADITEFFKNQSFLGDYYFDAQDLNSHEKVCGQMIAALKGIQNITDHKELLEYAVMACTKLGDVADIRLQKSSSKSERIEYFHRAEEWYMQAYAYALDYFRLEDSLKARRFVYTPLMRLADERYMYLNLPLSENLDDYRKVYTKILEADGLYPCTETRADLCACHKCLMEIYNALGMDDDALENGNHMLDYARQGYLESRTFISLAKYMKALESFSVLQLKNGFIDDARQNLNKATQARTQYIESLKMQRIDSTEAAYSLIIDYVNLFDINEKLGRAADAQTCLEQALICAKQYHLENNPDVYNALAGRLN